MKKVKLRPIIKHGVGYWIVPYLVPSWCSSCPPDRKTIVIKSQQKPSIKVIKKKLKELDYEIED